MAFRQSEFGDGNGIIRGWIDSASDYASPFTVWDTLVARLVMHEPAAENTPRPSVITLIWSTRYWVLFSFCQPPVARGSRRPKSLDLGLPIVGNAVSLDSITGDGHRGCRHEAHPLHVHHGRKILLAPDEIGTTLRPEIIELGPRRGLYCRNSKLQRRQRTVIGVFRQICGAEFQCVCILEDNEKRNKVGRNVAIGSGFPIAGVRGRTTRPLPSRMRCP